MDPHAAHLQVGSWAACDCPMPCTLVADPLKVTCFDCYKVPLVVSAWGKGTLLMLTEVNELGKKLFGSNPKRGMDILPKSAAPPKAAEVRFHGGALTGKGFVDVSFYIYGSILAQGYSYGPAARHDGPWLKAVVNVNMHTTGPGVYHAAPTQYLAFPSVVGVTPQLISAGIAECAAKRGIHIVGDP